MAKTQLVTPKIFSHQGWGRTNLKQWYGTDTNTKHCVNKKGAQTQHKKNLGGPAPKKQPLPPPQTYSALVKGKGLARPHEGLDTQMHTNAQSNFQPPMEAGLATDFGRSPQSGLEAVHPHTCWPVTVSRYPGHDNFLRGGGVSVEPEKGGAIKWQETPTVWRQGTSRPEIVFATLPLV